MGVQGGAGSVAGPAGLASEPGVRAAGYAGGGLAGVPHSAQNFAVALRSALQLVQCFAMGVPHSPQNFEPTRTALWHCGHSIVASAAGAAAGAAAAGAAGGGACGGCCTKPWPPPAKPGPGGGATGACCGACIMLPAMPMPAPRNIGVTAPTPCAMPSPAPC